MGQEHWQGCIVAAQIQREADRTPVPPGTTKRSPTLCSVHQFWGPFQCPLQTALAIFSLWFARWPLRPIYLAIVVAPLHPIIALIAIFFRPTALTALLLFALNSSTPKDRCLLAVHEDAQAEKCERKRTL